MKRKQMPILVKLLLFVLIFAVIGYLVYQYKDFLFGL